MTKIDPLKTARNVMGDIVDMLETGDMDKIDAFIEAVALSKLPHVKEILREAGVLK